MRDRRPPSYGPGVPARRPADPPPYQRPDTAAVEALLARRRVLLRGHIDHAVAKQAYMMLFFVDATAAKAGDATIHLLVDSPGGVVDDSFAVRDAMRHVKSPIDTHGLGRVGGLATLLVATGRPGGRAAKPACFWSITPTQPITPAVSEADLRLADAQMAADLAACTSQPASHWSDVIRSSGTFDSETARRGA